MSRHRNRYLWPGSGGNLWTKECLRTDLSGLCTVIYRNIIILCEIIYQHSCLSFLFPFLSGSGLSHVVMDKMTELNKHCNQYETGLEGSSCSIFLI